MYLFYQLEETNQNCHSTIVAHATFALHSTIAFASGIRVINTALDSQSLLGDNDPYPVEWQNQHSTGPVLLICEHAGQHVPECLNSLGLSVDNLNDHIGWDIGAGLLAKQISNNLSAPLISQRYSRLVIDCNRPTNNAGSVPIISDGVAIAANKNASDREISARQAEIFHPFNAAIENAISNHKPGAAFSIHSFTPSMDGFSRPWHAGFLSRSDINTATLLMNHIAKQNSELCMAVNQPYQIDDDTDWFIPQHAETHGLKHTLIEVRNDLLRSAEDITYWAGLISSAIVQVLQEESR